MPGGQDAGEGLAIYESEPPQWLPKTHTSSDLGYPGFYPPRPDQEEDDLSEANVKSGLTIGHAVPAETFSAQDVAKSQFQQDNALADLEGLMNQVFARRADHVPAIPPSSFRIPSRVTMNDAKRQAWFDDLANPNVPLHKLGKNVPHGAKGHDLLDLLHTHNVAIPRAVWFLRVFGANETAGLRNKPSYNPTQYSVDTAGVITSYLKKQLADIALPSAPRPGLNIKQTFKGVLGENDTRDRWISRFTYCLKILRTFYSEGLIDRRVFLSWLVQQMSACNLAQAGFVARLADEYLDGMLSNRALARPFVEACLAKLSEIRATSAQEHLVHLEALLKTLLQRVCLALSDAFVSPAMWNVYSNLLCEVLTEDITCSAGEQPVEQKAREIHQTLSDNFSDIQRRNETLLFRNLPPRALARLGSAVSDIQLLNSITSNADMDTYPFFDTSTDDISSSFPPKLDILLTWSVSSVQYGDHRPYAAVALLHQWRDRAEERATRRDTTSPDEFVQDRLFDWLDGSDIAGEEGNLRAVAILFGKLVKHELFSYANYIQRLIARGEPGLSNTQEGVSRHRNFLLWIPLHQATSSLVSQRKVALHGVRVRETPEDLKEREIRKEIRTVLPQLFGGELPVTLTSTTALLGKCPILLSASRFEQVRIFRQWLLPIFRKYVSSHVPEVLVQLNLYKSYCMTVELMVHAKCYGSLIDLTLFTLGHASTSELLMAVVETLHMYMHVWSAMNITGSITTALHSAHQTWRTKGIQSRALLALLVEVDNGRHLDQTCREHVGADISAFTHALFPQTDRPDTVPRLLPEILLLAEDPSTDAPSVLANSLWYKYRTAFDWAWKVWDNTVASLRQIPVMTSDIASREACALRYGTFLWHVDQHLPAGFDDQILQWFLGPGKSEVLALTSDAWDVLTVVLLYLCVEGALATTTIMRGLVYPAWQLGASATSVQEGQSLEVPLRAINHIFERLILREEGNPDGLPPVDLLDIRRIRAHRRDVYREPHFSLLASNIPMLVFVENNESIPQDLRASFTSIRCTISESCDFREGTYRNLDVIRASFEEPLMRSEMEDRLYGPLVDAMRLILSDSHGALSDLGLSDWHDISSLLSPWKLAATAIQLQFVLQQIGRDMTQGSNHSSASDSLDNLIFTIFRHTMTSEEAYFVAEMARGVSTPVAGKFINNGLQCIHETLDGLPIPLEERSLLDCLERAGELLRVLAHVAEPLRDDTALLPQLESDIQDRFIKSLCAKFKLVESELSGSETAEERLNMLPMQETIIFLSRLLQFDLGFQGVWTKATKEVRSELTSVLFKLVMFHGSGDKLDLVVYPLLVDTLYYLVDGPSAESKTLVFDPFINYPDFPLLSLPTGIPTSYLGQIRSFLPHLPPNQAISDLVTAHRDTTTGNLIHGLPVLNRPWEWIENLGDPAAQEDENARHAVKNAGSLSLDLFGARTTGDGIVHYSDLRIEGNTRAFEDSLSAESIFKRDWRETRLELDELPAGVNRIKEEEDELGKLPPFHGHGKVVSKSTSRRGSPASSVRSRTSAPGSYRMSPSQTRTATGSTMSEPIDVDSLTTGSGSSTKQSTKRKAASSADDDEIEIIEGPVPVPSRASKKPKISSRGASKTRAKKR